MIYLLIFIVLIVTSIILVQLGRQRNGYGGEGGLGTTPPRDWKVPPPQ